MVIERRKEKARGSIMGEGAETKPTRRGNRRNKLHLRTQQKSNQII